MRTPMERRHITVTVPPGPPAPPTPPLPPGAPELVGWVGSAGAPLLPGIAEAVVMALMR